MNVSLRGRSDTKRMAAAGTVLVLVLGLTACGGGGGGGNGPGPKQLNLVIGNSLPLSGSSESLGKSGRKASALAIDQIKQAIGETGAAHTVRAISRDEGPDAVSATESARTLVGGDRASCLTGPWSADAIAPVAENVVIPAKALEITPVPTGADVADLSDHDLVNSTALPESLEGVALSDAIERDLGGARGKSVSVAAADDGYASALSDDFVKDWQNKDGTIGGPTVLPPLAPDYADQAERILVGNPNAILLLDGPDGFSRLAPSLASSAGWDPAIAWGSDRLVSTALPSEVGTGAIDGMRALAPGIPDGADASSAFVQDFSSSEPHGIKPAPFAAQEFDATVLCYLAAVAAGSTDGQQMADHLIDITAPGGDQFSWQQLPAAVRALEDGKDIDYVGASGPINMDVHGNPTAGVFDIYRYSGNSLEVVGEVSAETPNPAVP